LDIDDQSLDDIKTISCLQKRTVRREKKEGREEGRGDGDEETKGEEGGEKRKEGITMTPPRFSRTLTAKSSFNSKSLSREIFGTAALTTVERKIKRLPNKYCGDVT
jgi:hypothetical protein